MNWLKAVIAEVVLGAIAIVAMLTHNDGVVVGACIGAIARGALEIYNSKGSKE